MNLQIYLLCFVALYLDVSGQSIIPTPMPVSLTAPPVKTPMPTVSSSPAPVSPVVAPVVSTTQQPSPGLQDGVAVKVVYNGKGWIGIGLTETGKMIETQGTVIGIPNGEVSTDVMIYSMTAYSLSGIVPWSADQQVLQNQSIDQTAINQTIMAWRMPFPENSFGIFPIIWAYGTSNTLAYHGSNRSNKIFPLILDYCADSTTAASPKCKPDDPNYDQVNVLKEGVLTIYTKQIKIRVG
mmetsp:Transcript_24928/g.35722  ORF Transcript_24928/g.35722 Transcript_24928/m.35722 type:complete len:238 (-) Transcript_24928:131-844(-)